MLCDNSSITNLSIFANNNNAVPLNEWNIVFLFLSVKNNSLKFKIFFEIYGSTAIEDYKYI